LVSRNRKRRAKLEDAVIPLDQLQLGSGLVEVEASTDGSRQGDRPLRLDGDVVSRGHVGRISE
jgi:hypothetical protein